MFNRIWFLFLLFVLHCQNFRKFRDIYVLLSYTILQFEIIYPQTINNKRLETLRTYCLVFTDIVITEVAVVNLFSGHIVGIKSKKFRWIEFERNETKKIYELLLASNKMFPTRTRTTFLRDFSISQNLARIRVLFFLHGSLTDNMVDTIPLMGTL